MKIMVITSVQPQAGKTTLAVNLAMGLGGKGYDCILIDMGKQPEAQQWLGRVGLIPCGSFSALEQVQTNPVPVDFVIVDLDLVHTDAVQILPLAHAVWLVVNLEDGVNSESLHNCDKRLKATRGAGADVVVPYQVNLREWQNNERKLLSLVDYFGEERIASPVPG